MLKHTRYGGRSAAYLCVGTTEDQVITSNRQTCSPTPRWHVFAGPSSGVSFRKVDNARICWGGASFQVIFQNYCICWYAVSQHHMALAHVNW
jgi:hypothetical protein